MLFDMIIDPTGFDPAQSSRSARDLTRDILDRFGVLHYTDTEILSLKDALGTKSGEWARWMEVLTRVPLCKRSSKLPEHPLPTKLGIGQSEDALVVLSSENARRWLEQLGLDPDLPRAHVPGSQLELVLTNEVSMSEVAGKRAEWSACQLSAPMTGRELWTERLRRLFRHASSITIVDGYAFGGQALPLKSPATSGLPWLIEQIGADSGINTAPALTLCAMLPDPPYDDRGYLESLVDELWSRAAPNLRELVVSVVPQRLFSGTEHRRYMRFAGTKSNRMLTLDHSLDRLSDQQISPPVTCTYWLPRTAELATCRQNEGRLSTLAARDGFTLKRD